MTEDGEQDAGTSSESGGAPADPPDDTADELATVVTVLDDPRARAILRRTTDSALSADELVDASDASRSTVYRRIRRLVELDLLAERQELDPDGHHFKTYRARLDRVTIDLDSEGFEIGVSRRPVQDDAVDRLNRLFERLKR